MINIQNADRDALGHIIHVHRIYIYIYATKRNETMKQNPNKTKQNMRSKHAKQNVTNRNMFETK